MIEVTEYFKGSDFSLFATLVEKGNFVRAIPAPSASSKARSFFDKLNDWAKGEGQGGLGYIIYDNDGNAKGPIASKLTQEQLDGIKNKANIKNGDSVFFVCGKDLKTIKFSGLARNRIAEELDICEKDIFKFCFSFIRF